MHTGEFADSNDSPVSFVEWLKKRRRSLDLTQDELAQRAGCSVFALRKIESGERRPSKQLASLLARALEIDPQEQATFLRVARGELNLERLSPPTGASRAFRPLRPAADDASPTPALRLPLPATPLIGRERELTAIERLYTDQGCRLLTLTGPGGVGKTRMAIEFASSQSDLFPGGRIYVPLASLTSTEHIIPAMAEAMNFTFSGSADPKKQIFNYLSERTQGPVLLVFDNLEHLLAQPSTDHRESGGAEAHESAVLALIGEILGRLPQVRILATSRERLNLQGEWTYELHGLPAPPLEFAGQLEDYPAAKLFLQSARRVKGDFEVSTQQLPDVVQICQMLEGVPLAIELSAAWIGVLPVGEIASEIQSDMDFLTTTLRNVPHRHRSMRASFDHSWRLLPEDECQALMRLSVFQGGFDRAAVERVAGAGLPVLASLVSKSLVRYAEGGRYDLHEVIRQFAFAHFQGDPRFGETRDRHAVYYLSYLADREEALKSSQQQKAFLELGGELENLRLAWGWAIEQEMFSLLEEAVRSLAWFMETGGLLDEGIELFDQLVNGLESAPQSQHPDCPRALGRTLAQQGLLIFHKGLFDKSCERLERSVELLRPCGVPALLVDPLVNLGVILHLNGEFERAKAVLEEGMACAQASGEAWFIAYAGFNQGYLASLLGSPSDGYQQMLDGLALWRKTGDPRSISLGSNYISPIAIQLERYADAQAFLEESLALCTQSKDRWGMGTAYRYLGLNSLAQGRYSEALCHFQKSLEMFHGFVTGWDIARTLTYMGETHRAAGDFPQARQATLEALRIADEFGAVALVLEALMGLADLESRGSQEELAVILASMILQHPASTQEIKDRARVLRTVLEAQYPPEQVRKLRQQAEAATLEGVVQEILGPLQPHGT